MQIFKIQIYKKLKLKKKGKENQGHDNQAFSPATFCIHLIGIQSIPLNHHSSYVRHCGNLTADNSIGLNEAQNIQENLPEFVRAK